jgi:hypothetical protein
LIGLKNIARNFRRTLICFIIFPANGINAQETITTSGGNASGSGGSVSFTVGQVAYTTNTSSAGTVSQGVQQPIY